MMLKSRCPFMKLDVVERCRDDCALYMPLSRSCAIKAITIEQARQSDFFTRTFWREGKLYPETRQPEPGSDEPRPAEICGYCNGSGKLTAGNISASATCPDCHGTGRKGKEST